MLTEQSGDGVQPEPPQPQRWQVGAFEGTDIVLPCGEQHRDGLDLHPTTDEQQGGRGGFIEPVSVVDHGEHRPFFGRLSQQAQSAQKNQEPVAAPTDLLPEGHPQRVCLRLW